MSSIVSVSQGKIAFYSTPDSNVYVEVVFKDESFWMTQKAMTELFDVDKSVISRHLKNIFEEEELDEEATVAKIATVQNEGGREVTRTMFIDYAELMAEDGVAMSMQDWLSETNTFLKNNRRGVLPDKGQISHVAAMNKASGIYEHFRIKQDRDYISQFDREMAKYLKGNGGDDE